MPPTRPRLTPAIADVRRAVRECLASLAARHTENAGVSASEGAQLGASARESAESPAFSVPPLVLVALSGGPDSLALAAATAFEAPRAGLRAGAVIVNHGLQPGSADAAAAAARQAEHLGLDPVTIRDADVGEHGGPEAAARSARYRVLVDAMQELGAAAVLLGHTLDDQAETVLLGLARGSGPASLGAMRPRVGPYLRPLLGIRRSTTVQFCVDSDLTPWHDPHNDDEQFARVRVRKNVLPVLEREIGPGITEALARTAEQLREDSDALDHFAEELAEDLAEHSEAGLSLPVAALAANPAALRQRLIRLAVAVEFGTNLSRTHTLEVARLVTDWHGQKPLDLPGVSVERRGSRLHFTARDEGADTNHENEDHHGIQ